MGGANQFLLTLDLLKMVDVKKFDFVHLLSGVDMPIKSIKQFDAFFEGTSYKGFFSFDPQVDIGRCEKERLGRFYLYDVFNPRSRMLCPRVVNMMVAKTQDFIERQGCTIRKPMKLKVYKGAQWFSISNDIVKYIVEFCSKNEWYVKRFKWTSCCDEIFFHTIVMNSPYAEKICHCDLRYIDWKQKIEGESLPRILDESDYEDIISSDRLFCRKLDEEKSRTLINKIRRNISSQK